MIPIRLPHAFPVRFLYYSAAYFSVLPSFSPRDFPRFVFLFTGKPKRAATANADRACLCFYSVSHRDNFCKRKMRPRFPPRFLRRNIRPKNFAHFTIFFENSQTPDRQLLKFSFRFHIALVPFYKQQNKKKPVGKRKKTFIRREFMPQKSDFRSFFQNFSSVKR